MKYTQILVFSMTLMLLISCNKEEAIKPPIKVSFDQSVLSLGKGDKEATAKITFSKPISKEATLEIKVNTDLQNDTDYYADPAVDDKEIMTLVVPSGATEATFKIFKKKDFEAEKTLRLDLTTIKGESLLTKGEQSSINIVFSQSEQPTQGSGKPRIDMGGKEETKQVLIDLSTGEIQSNDRFVWDLAFVNKQGVFEVRLNGGAEVFAKSIAKDDLSLITEDDIKDYKDKMVPGFAHVEASDWIDDHEGDISKAAIGNIPSNPSEVKTYIIAVVHEGNSEHYKVRITQKAKGYQLEFAKVNESTISTMTITKTNQSEYTYLSLKEGKVIDISPKQWDLKFTQHLVRYPYGAGAVPYQFKDYVIQNTNVEVAMVEGTSADYTAFAKDQVASQSFSNKVNTIGSTWRKTYGGVKIEQVFYILKDHEDNVYKLKFVSMVDPDTNERGYIQFEYELL